jgi:hypothetical protein
MSAGNQARCVVIKRRRDQGQFLPISQGPMIGDAKPEQHVRLSDT